MVTACREALNERFDATKVGNDPGSTLTAIGVLDRVTVHKTGHKDDEKRNVSPKEYHRLESLF